MDELQGTNALLTGAAGGLGRHIARALAAEGVSLALSGRQREPLELLRHRLRRAGTRAEVVLADLADLGQAATLVEQAEAKIGPLDLLINNAGIELPAAYTAFTDEELAAITRVNLIAPMVLTRHALIGMRERGRGHIVAIASLAGRGGGGYNAPYATTKAGLLNFVRSLRAELDGTPVGASVICPGFIADDGMYPRMQQETGLNAPPLLRPVEPERVVDAVIDSILQDRPDVLVTPWPMRPMLAIQELAPELAERIVAGLGPHDFFARLSEATHRMTASSPFPSTADEASAGVPALR